MYWVVLRIIWFKDLFFIYCGILVRVVTGVIVYGWWRVVSRVIPSGTPFCSCPPRFLYLSIIFCIVLGSFLIIVIQLQVLTSCGAIFLWTLLWCVLVIIFNVIRDLFVFELMCMWSPACADLSQLFRCRLVLELFLFLRWNI